MMDRVPVGAMVVTVALRMGSVFPVDALAEQGESAALRRQFAGGRFGVLLDEGHQPLAHLHAFRGVVGSAQLAAACQQSP